MRSSPIILLASAGLVLAQPSENHRNHKRFHEIKARGEPTPTEKVIVVGPTIAVYELNGKPISYAELQQGLKNGSLVLDRGAPVPAPNTVNKDVEVKAQSVEATQPVVQSSSLAPAPSPSPETSSAAPSPAPQPSPEASQSQSNSAPSNYGKSGSGSSGDTSRAYDNSLPCSEFPSAFGAMSVDWQGMGGWIGIQIPASTGYGGMSNIVTATKGQGCTEGAYCSYACPAGMEKSQWPSTQGAAGQSVGGLLCKNGKLTLTRPEVPQLCSSSTGEVTVSIQNKLSQGVAVCRTDYPGTEAMSVPLSLAPGEISPIACPDAETSYTWKGGATSAQYYVNPAGVSVQDACIWGQAGKDVGNWAPMNIGVGYSNGAAYLSIFQNAPTTQSKLNFKVTIVSDSMSGTCSYSNGQYEGGGNGCTVSIKARGNATYVFEDA